MSTLQMEPIRLWYAEFIWSIFNALWAGAQNLSLVLKKKKRWLYIAAACGMVSGAMSFAQMGAPGVSPTGEVDLSADAPPVSETKVNKLQINTAQLVTQLASGMDTQLQKIKSGSSLAGYQNILIGFGLAVGLIWSGVRMLAMGKGLGELFAEWVPIFMAVGVVTALLDNGGAQSIINTMDQIAGGISGQNVSSIAALMNSAVPKTLNTIFSVVDMPSASQSQSLFDMMTTGFVQTLMAVVMKSITCIVIVIATCVYLATAIMAMMSLSLVMGLAKIMVPFLIFKPLAWIFESWLKFLLGACMLKLVGAFMLMMTGGMIDQMVNIATIISKDTQSSSLETLALDFVMYAVLLLIAVLNALLMAQTPGIATGLLSGSAGAGGFSGLKAASQNTGARMASSAASGAGGGAWNRTAGSALAAHQGKKDAQAGLSSSMGRYNNASQHRAYQKSHKANRPSPPPAP